jgi:hypothetical protein
MIVLSGNTAAWESHHKLPAMGPRGGISQLQETEILISGKILTGFNNDFKKKT